MVLAWFCTSVILVILMITLVVHLARTKNAVFNQISAFFAIKRVDDHWEINENTGVFLSMIADLFNEKLKASLKGSLMNSISQVSRNEKALMRDVGKEVLAQENPMAGLFLDQLPKKWQNKIFENPAAAQAAINLFNSAGGGSPAPGPGNGNGGGQDFTKGLSKWGG